MDEVGRGAWAGPVLVSAVVPGEGDPPDGLTDSKRLTPPRRQELAEQIERWVAAHVSACSEPAGIDAAGLTGAPRRPARRARAEVPPCPDPAAEHGGR